MEPNPARYYQPSGAVPFLGTVLMQLFGAGAALVLGIAYAAANHYSPSVWLTFFAVLIYGAGVGFAVNLGAKIGKVRSQGFILLLGTATGILAVYFAWVFYIFFLTQRMALVWNPSIIFEAMKAFAETGLWSFKDWTPKGWVLWTFWVTEAGTIVLLSLAVALANDTPFCDYCNAWTKKSDDVASFPLTDFEQLKADLEAERYEVLDRLRQEPVDPSNRLKAIIHACPQCEDSDFLTISHAQIVKDSDGNDTTNETEVVKHLRIPREMSEHLHAMGVPIAYEEEIPEEAPAAEDPMEI